MLLLTKHELLFNNPHIYVIDMTCVRVFMFTKHCLGCRGNLCINTFVNTDEALNKMHTGCQPPTGAIINKTYIKKYL